MSTSSQGMFPQVSTVHSVLHVGVFFLLCILAHDRGNREDMHVSNVCVCVCVCVVSQASPALLTRKGLVHGATLYSLLSHWNVNEIIECDVVDHKICIYMAHFVAICGYLSPACACLLRLYSISQVGGRKPNGKQFLLSLVN